MDASRPPRLLDQVRQPLRTRHYSFRTERSYLGWIKRFILFHGKRHPRAMGAAEIEAFLTHLAVNRNVASATQNQALNAISFLYREVLGIELPWLDNIHRAKKPKRLPTVLTRADAPRFGRCSRKWTQSRGSSPVCSTVRGCDWLNACACG